MHCTQAELPSLTSTSKQRTLLVFLNASDNVGNIDVLWSFGNYALGKLLSGKVEVL